MFIMYRPAPLVQLDLTSVEYLHCKLMQQRLSTQLTMIELQPEYGAPL